MTHIIFMSLLVHGFFKVMTCQGAYADVYSDRSHRMLLPNPIMADEKGRVEFYTPNKCVIVREIVIPK